MTLDNIKKQINLLDMVTESYIKRLIEKYDSITEDKLIQFYIDYIYYLVDKLNLLGLPMNSIIDIKYSLLLKNSETLKISTIDTAKTAQRPIVDIETLRQCNKDLITSIKEVIKIHEQGAIKREQAQEELVKIEEELKQTMLESAN